MQTIEQSKSTPKAEGLKPRTLWSSTSLLLGAALLLGCLWVVNLPPRCLDASDGIPSKYKVLVSKLSAFLASSENPDVIILGSSLVLMPAVRCDDRLKGKLDCYDDWYYYKHIPEYTEAQYLEHLLARVGLPVSIKNLGIASSIMSDHAGVLETILAEGKRPGLVICGIAPRDFLDNSQRNFKNTPTQMFLKEYHSAPTVFPSALSKDSVASWVEANEHQFKKFLARLRDNCSDFVCKITNHPPALQHVKTKETAYMEGRPNLLKDLETYRRLYNPPNYQMLAEQARYLQKLLSLAKKNHIEVLLVNMPLTKENTNALDAEVHRRYLQTIAEISGEFGATLLDIGSTSIEYTLGDFEDCCHLNAAGGEKLYKSVFETLLHNQRLSAALKPTPVQVAAKGATAH